jgi:hypothetical protein
MDLYEPDWMAKIFPKKQFHGYKQENVQAMKKTKFRFVASILQSAPRKPS